MKNINELIVDDRGSHPLSKTEPSEQVTEQVQKLLFYSQRQPLDVREIMQSLKLNHRPMKIKLRNQFFISTD